MNQPPVLEEQRSEKQGQTPGITGQLDLEVRLEIKMMMMMMMMSGMATVHYYCIEHYYVTCAFWWQIVTCHLRAYGEGVCVRCPLQLDVEKTSWWDLIATAGLGHLDNMEDAVVLDTANTCDLPFGPRPWRSTCMESLV